MMKRSFCHCLGIEKFKSYTEGKRRKTKFEELFVISLN